MTSQPTGRLLPIADGVDLVLTRHIRGTIDDVWSSITESERTARWFGRWEGPSGTGSAIRVQMTQEGDDVPWSDATIEACEPPHLLALAVSDAAGGWRLQINLVDQGDWTDLTFVHHLDHTDGVGDIGPGWEYYLDMLIASRESTPVPSFDDYHPSMCAYFTDQLPAITAAAADQDTVRH